MQIPMTTGPASDWARSSKALGNPSWIALPTWPMTGGGLSSGVRKIVDTNNLETGDANSMFERLTEQKRQKTPLNRPKGHSIQKPRSLERVSSQTRGG